MSAQPVEAVADDLTDFPADRPIRDAQGSFVGGEPSPARARTASVPTAQAPVQDQTPQQARMRSSPKNSTPAGIPDSPADQGARDPHAWVVGGGQITGQGHMPLDAHHVLALPGSDSPADQQVVDAQLEDVGGGTKPGAGAKVPPAPTGVPRPSLFDPELFTLAQLLDDIEGLRKATGNRLRIMRATEPDADGEVRGFGMPDDAPAVIAATNINDHLAAVEHEVILALQRAMRRHPLNAWRKTVKGVGEKQLARLLAATGDPYLRTFEDGTTAPRTVSQLWAYSGLHTLPSTGQPPDDSQPAIAGAGNPLPAAGHAGSATRRTRAGGGDSTTPAPTTPGSAPARPPSGPGSHVAAKRRKGQQANWSTDAKTRAYLIATSCIKQTGSVYRDVYDKRRAHTDVTHPDWTPGHSHNDALRVVSKRILRDLWRAARDHHEGTPA